MERETYYRYPKNFPLPLLLDGSTGRQLMKIGMPTGCSVEKYVLENPDKLIQIQSKYVNSGSDAVLTPTLNTTRPVLKHHGLDNVIKLNTELTLIAKKSGAKLVGGDMSTTESLIEPFDNIVEYYVEQVKGLEAGGVDFYMPETNINLNEVRAAVTAIRSISDKPIFVTMTIESNGRTMSGDTLLASLLTLAELGINAFGANCSTGPEEIFKLLEPIAPYAAGLGIPLIAKPNAGLPDQHERDAKLFGEYAEKFLNAGILIIGGCCGTDECHIAEMKKAIDKFDMNNLRVDPIDSSDLVCTNREVCKRSEAECIAVTDAEEFIEDSMFLDHPVTINAESEILNYIKKYYNGKI
ncbi:MAG: homocysteine S-methyltransferase family protein [Oscillospiraceae bacterium]|nr:homocysteine S-methyltransferase family protein [Oscillospiraceae bacterium]